MGTLFFHIIGVLFGAPLMKYWKFLSSLTFSDVTRTLLWGALLSSLTLYQVVLSIGLNKRSILNIFFLRYDFSFFLSLAEGRHQLKSCYNGHALAQFLVMQGEKLIPNHKVLGLVLYQCL